MTKSLLLVKTQYSFLFKRFQCFSLSNRNCKYFIQSNCWNSAFTHWRRDKEETLQLQPWHHLHKSQSHHIGVCGWSYKFVNQKLGQKDSFRWEWQMLSFIYVRVGLDTSQLWIEIRLVLGFDLIELRPNNLSSARLGWIIDRFILFIDFSYSLTTLLFFNTFRHFLQQTHQ